jgi:hypothetical protein
VWQYYLELFACATSAALCSSITWRADGCCGFPCDSLPIWRKVVVRQCCLLWQVEGQVFISPYVSSGFAVPGGQCVPNSPMHPQSLLASTAAVWCDSVVYLTVCSVCLAAYMASSVESSSSALPSGNGDVALVRGSSV